MSDTLLVHIGGSHRKLDKQIRAFAHAGIPVRSLGYAGTGHNSNLLASMPDTPAARELLKKMGGSIRREQWKPAEDDPQIKMM